MNVLNADVVSMCLLTWPNDGRQPASGTDRILNGSHSDGFRQPFTPPKPVRHGRLSIISRSLLLGLRESPQIRLGSPSKVPSAILVEVATSSAGSNPT